ncbi:gfo/Idh/MocA family oxidoreductase [Salinadaptatus halalkaliphilus]|uniref:Gfo/Idh/MocA family oxidoreductase n=1 Tax=Salinadaptatus halalkaliphilus TaxID=2419781 RepID=A0A4S3TK32_9EURY|nr:Gfo/Idh/MocA family oxidoreductase [Salinadaptatus halalkaliphilus]THE64431.1 gfo/Idh/MocA family oxidoreductase [Salinadaptatus halalkaliphilus]
MTAETLPIDVGVIGVGSMGQHHARVYNNLPSANLVGICDYDQALAEEVADEYSTEAMGLGELLDSVDAASIVVPTVHHYDLAVQCLETDIGIMIEKPVVDELQVGYKLLEKAKESKEVVQVGHVERFNPAIVALQEFLDELTVIDITSRRLGPPPNRDIADSAVIDLMIHDIDIVLMLLDEMPSSIQSVGVYGNRHATGLLEFDSGVMASLTASRLTQQTARTLDITAEECLVKLDYNDQSIDIHRSSMPEYLEEQGRALFREMTVIEQPQIYGEEPLARELESFLEVVASDGEPAVTVSDGLHALEVAQKIDETGTDLPAPSWITDD